MIEPALAALQETELAQTLRFSRWAYAAANTAHVLGIALLVGAIVPLDLRLLGFWRRIDHAELARVLVPVAAVGLVLAVAAGFLIFSVRALEYATLFLFRLKISLVVMGTASALALHATHGLYLETAGKPRLAWAGALSITCWTGALLAGRMIAFAGD